MLALFPMVDLDGVEGGRYGKDRPPRDMNRDWSANPCHVEVRAIRAAIADLVGRHRYRWFNDFHAPHPSGFSFPVPVRPSHLGKADWAAFWRFAALLAKEAPAECPIRAADYPLSAGQG